MHTTDDVAIHASPRTLPSSPQVDSVYWNIFHGGEFDVQTGKAVQMPAVVDIPVYAVRVVDGMIQVGIPKE